MTNRIPNERDKTSGNSEVDTLRWHFQSIGETRLLQFTQKVAVAVAVVFNL